MLLPCFQLSPSQCNIAVVKFHRNLCEIPYGGHQTGSSYNFGSKADRNVVSSAITMFSGVAVKMKLRPSCYFVDIYLKFNMAAMKKVAILNNSCRHFELLIDFDENTAKSILHCDDAPGKHGTNT